jgi:GT2 family glycosyltransferase
MVKTSLVIVTWNGKKVISQCLESLRRYSGDSSVEILVVDNASTDGTVEHLKTEFPFAKLIVNSSNLGFAKANNIGIAQATGEIVCLVNSDVEVPEGCFEKMAAYMEQNKRIGVLGPKMILADGSVGQSVMGFPTVWNWFCRALGLDNIFKSKFFAGYLRTDFRYDQVTDVEVLTGWFWMVRREALDQVGGLDERYFMYGEDIDWCKRYNQAGWRVVFYPDAYAVHYCGSSSANAPTRFYLEMHRANMQYCAKYHNGVARAGFWLATWLQEAARIVGYGAVYILKRSSRVDAGYKVKRSAVCLSWMMGFTPLDASKAR